MRDWLARNDPSLTGFMLWLRESGLGDSEPDDRFARLAEETRAETARAAFEAAGDPYYDALRAEMTAETELFLAQGQVDLARERLTALEQEKDGQEERLKVLNEPFALQRIEGFVGSNPDTPVYQVAPIGLKTDLLGLREEINRTRDLMIEARDARAQLMDQFRETFDEGTALRHQLADLIVENAWEQAAVQGTTKVIEFGVAFGTGGPIGLAVEMVSTPIFQHLFYEDGVIFESYDESAMQAAFQAARATEQAGEPDPEEACRGLNMQIRDAAMRRVFDATPWTTSAAAQISAVGGFGNTSQRVQDNWQHYSLYFMSQMAQEGAGNVAHRMNISRPGYMEAQAEAIQRVTIRAGINAKHQAINELAELDARIAARATSAVERTAVIEARQALITRIAADNPALASQLSSRGGDLAIYARQIAWKQRLLGKNLVSEGTAEALEAAIVRDLERIAARQATIQESLRRGAANIDWSRLLAHNTELNEALARELAKVTALEEGLMAFERKAARVGARGTTAGSAASIALSMVFALGNEWNQNRLQEQERDLWLQFMNMELQQSLRFRTWQRATCIYWALHDEYYAQRRLYSQLYDAFDPETGFELLTSDPIRSNESFELRLAFDPFKAHAIEVRLGAVTCRESAANTCRIEAGSLADEQGPQLPLDITIRPRE